MAWFVFLIPIVSVVAVFTFVAVATWSDNRRKEREAFYRHEIYAKMLEKSGDSAAEVAALMREEESQRQRRRIDGFKLGGLITTAVAVGLGVFLYYLEVGHPIYLVALIPFLVGLVLSFYGFVMAPRQARQESAAGG